VLLWQLKKWFSNFSIKTKIAFASLIGHCGILFSLFVLYRGNEQYHILVTGTMINTDVPIVFLPMHKSLMQQGGQLKSGIGGNSSKNSAAQIVPAVKKETIAAALPEIKSNPSRHRKASQDDLKKKNKKESKKKNKSQKIIEQKKAIAPEKAIKEQTKPIEPEKALEIPEQIKTAENIPVNSLPIGDDNQNVLYVGQQEMDALQMQDYIQQEMAQHWAPPAGMRKNISCIIKVIIAFDGSKSNLEVEQPSGVLIFDSAAKRAAAQLKPPACAYGKEILLTFKP
jgi:outer membrane biosynthesis protein TonB